jgi:hypothetical protein
VTWPNCVESPDLSKSMSSTPPLKWADFFAVPAPDQLTSPLAVAGPRCRPRRRNETSYLGGHGSKHLYSGAQPLQRVSS